jgi:hypothetical protein
MIWDAIKIILGCSATVCSIIIVSGVYMDYRQRRHQRTYTPKPMHIDRAPNIADCERRFIP